MEDTWKKWNASKSPMDFDELFKATQPVVNTALQSYVGRNVSPTIKQRANILAHDAIKTYDPAKGASLRSHLMIQLRPISRYAKKVSTPVEIPDKRISDIYKLNAAERELGDKLGRPASDAELSDFTNLSIKRLRAVRNSALIEARPNISEEGGAEMDLPSATVNPEDVWIDMVYHDLDPVNQKIMEWKLGLNGNEQLPNQEIAKRLRLTPSAVSQRTNTIVKRLREFNTLPGDII